MTTLKSEPFLGGDLPHHEEGHRRVLVQSATCIDRRIALRTLAVLSGGLLVTVSRKVVADDCTKEARTPILGPYYLGEPEEKYDTGDGIVVKGRVLAADCTPIAGATVVRWHANRFGIYEEYFRATMPVKADGSFQMSTIKPGKYANLDRHIHWYVSAPGHTPVIAQIQWTDAEEIPAEATFDFSLTKG